MRPDGIAQRKLQGHSACMRIALFEPEIAGNVGAVLRLCACMGAGVDLIEPMGFAWDDRRVRRSAMDYIDHVAVARHASFEVFKATVGSRRLVLFTTKASQSAYSFSYNVNTARLSGRPGPRVSSRRTAARRQLQTLTYWRNADARLVPRPVCQGGCAREWARC
jgi:tRNA (cytidine/uridine-2'-O-)-methyltransferase